MNREVKDFLARIGRKGGRKSRRRLDSETARAMVRLREARRAFRRYQIRCFWSYDPEYKVEFNDIPWVADQLRKHGDREAWKIAGKLCP